MTIRQVSAKINTRLNKSASSDYDNLWSKVKEEAFNKAITDSVRRMFKREKSNPGRGRRNCGKS